jgi:DNA repair photolyase
VGTSSLVNQRGFIEKGGLTMPVIYEPKGRAKEYALLAINHYTGCEHGCKYCWAEKNALHWGNPDFHVIQKPKVHLLNKLKREVAKFRGTDIRVLLSFSTDPYQSIDDKLELTRDVIKLLGSEDIPFQILTKGGLRAVRDFDLYGSRDAFGSTLTFLDEKRSLNLEPKAALPADRIEAIRIAKEEHGIETWVSLEPVLDERQTLDIIRQTAPIVDLFRIGKLNYWRSDINWARFGKKAIELCRENEVDYYIKQDLAAYLNGVPFTSIDRRKVKCNATIGNTEIKNEGM